MAKKYNGKLAISNGNKKIGKIPNISLPPIKTCAEKLPCFKKCYALKSYKFYPSVKNAWDNNLAIYQKSPLDYFVQIENYLENKKPDFFRWHVSGDFIDNEYLHGVISLANMFTHVNFLAFTKKHSLLNDYRAKEQKIPSNMQIVFSMWHGMELDNPFKFPVAWCQDGTEKRIPENALFCAGLCEHCMLCWHLNRINRDVYFKLH